ncbi:MAG TPA: UDP-3-O-(3-hydroxymyristoyl)glucosamine N-acyltransferase [Terriglobia bacterium]|nr:UDP-3-O-(3-hydroxymyristoyl)glucosamine N-acyltransferase [Terriglobia bacterium]
MMKVEEIARLVGGRVEGDPGREIQSVASLEAAAEADLTFAEGHRALRRAAESKAGCVLVKEGAAIASRTTIAVSHPKMALIRAAMALHPASVASPGVHPTALVASDARLGTGVCVGPYVVIEPGVSVGEGTTLGAGVFLGAGVAVGARCVLHPRVSVYAGARIGHRVIVHAGAVLGSDGFGYVFAEGRHHKFPQLGGLIIEDDVDIGANSTVDRGSLGTTVIGEGTKIDNLVQIAHNVKIGRHAIIAAQTGISGSAEIGDYVMMGGQVGIGDHARIGEGAIIGGQAGILPGKAVPKGNTMWGTPARPLAEFKKMYAYLSHLPELVRKVKALASKRPPAKE